MSFLAFGAQMRSLARVVAFAAGCSAPQSATMTAEEARGVRDTVSVLENAMNLAVDGLDCAKAHESVGDREPMFVTGSHVVRTRAAFRQACDGLIANRTGAVFAVDTLTAQALSRDAAYVVREGAYTVSMKDGSYMVMTTVWDRSSGAWKMVHLHESYRALAP